jgi:1-acyl-sn-glycerol-3-phosphate acyltransferase
MDNRTSRLCVIIPTYNNAGTIRQVIEDVSRFCQHIIVVNDGCTDNTANILQSLLKESISPTLTIVSYEKNRGKGHALVVGFRKAQEMGFTHAITIDADGQHFADDIPHLLKASEQHPQAIIVGCRNLTEENMPRGNTFANRFSNFWFRLQTGIHLSDTQSGYRLYPLSSLCGLSLITSRYEAELELLVFAAWAGTPIASVPVKVYYPPAGERVSHFRPVYDFIRISLLNTVLCLVALLRGLRQWAYTIFSFCYFLLSAVELTLRGFFLITLGGATDEHKLKYHQILQRRALFIINHVPGTTFSYSTPHNESFEKPSVIISNHQSHLDLMGIMMLTPKLIILTKNWVWHNPFYGIIIRYADFFPITETEQMTQVIAEKVRKGYSVMIFPEGTRSEDCRIQRFHRGAFYLAEKLGLDILPVFIDGFGTVLPKKSFHLHPGHMSVDVMSRQPMDCDYREMTRKMHRLYEELKN